MTGGLSVPARHLSVVESLMSVLIEAWYSKNSQVTVMVKVAIVRQGTRLLAKGIDHALLVLKTTI
jgi:hypothetical protein